MLPLPASGASARCAGARASRPARRQGPVVPKRGRAWPIGRRSICQCQLSPAPANGESRLGLRPGAPRRAFASNVRPSCEWVPLACRWPSHSGSRPRNTTSKPGLTSAPDPRPRRHGPGPSCPSRACQCPSCPCSIWGDRSQTPGEAAGLGSGLAGPAAPTRSGRGAQDAPIHDPWC